MGDREKSPDLPGMRFQSIHQTEVPKGRDGKHRQIISQLLNDISHLSDGLALKVPLAELPDTKENIRSALNRAARQKQLDLATSSNKDYLFIWKVTKKGRNGRDGKD
jgi:hypothetical protein